MLSNHRDILVSVDNYCSDFNAGRQDFCEFLAGEVGAATNRILGLFVKTGYAEHDYLTIKVLPTVKV